MGYFPLCIDLSGKTVILVGGGEQIRDKAEKLRPFQPELVFLDGLTAEELEERPACVIVGDLPRASAATIARMCAAKDIPVNVVDRPELCTFFFPSLIQRGDLTVSVSTGGKAPAVAAYLRQDIQREIPDGIEQIMDSLTAFRLKLRSRHPAGGYRDILKEAVSLAFTQNRPLTEAECHRLMGSVTSTITSEIK